MSKQSPSHAYGLMSSPYMQDVFRFESEDSPVVDPPTNPTPVTQPASPTDTLVAQLADAQATIAANNVRINELETNASTLTQNVTDGETRIAELEQQLTSAESTHVRELFNLSLRQVADLSILADKADAAFFAEFDYDNLPDGVTFDRENLEITGFDAHVKALRTSKPYLFKPLNLPRRSALNTATVRDSNGQGTYQRRQKRRRVQL